MANSQYELPVSRDQLIDFVASRSGIDRARVTAVIDTCAAEVTVGLDLIRDHAKPGTRILEVGSGIGLLIYELHRSGFDIMGLEPGASGFGESARIGTAIRERLGTDLPVFDKKARELDPDTEGTFDLIFSVNVLEHMPELEAELEGMTRVLKPNGLMIHTCANYAVPYEPHYGIPLVPGFPKATAILQPQLSQQELWQ
jgi:2-polyprenyl-3-methyl-5-hydroxy-6-metoxy-1,4-benzoquinol methylase